MKLPNAQSSTVTEQKVVHYLLNPAHPAGGIKARFFLRFGFTAVEWRQFAEALPRHARENNVVETQQTVHGRRYVVDGPMPAPDGTQLNIRSAWYIDRVDDGPRFANAHPLPKI